MAAANIISSICGVALFVYVARTLSPEAFGYLSYAFTLVFFLANFIDLGLSTYGIREVAKNRPRASVYVSEIVSFRLIIAFVLISLLCLAAWIAHRPSALLFVMLESSLLLITFALATEWAFQGIEKMHFVFISFAATSILQLTLIYLFVKHTSDLLKVPVIYFLATLPIAAIFLKKFGFRLKIMAEDLRKMMSYMSSSLVIWSISLFTQIYNNMDIFLLGLFRRMSEVGYFTIARRLVSGSVILMVFLANALLPRLSASFAADSAQFRSATRKFLAVAGLFTVGVLMPVMIFTDRFIVMAFGSKYLPAGPPVKIMIIGLIFVLFNLPYSTGLIAAGLEKQVLFQAAASAALSITSNFILIPKYGMIGASLSFVFAEALALIWIACLYERKMGKFL